MMTYEKADSVVGRWLKTIGWCLVALVIAGIVLAAIGGGIYLVVHIVSAAWHSGK